MGGSAVRMQRHRERQRADRMLLTIDISREPLASMLIEAGLLDPLAEDDQENISAAVAHLLNVFIQDKLQ